MYTAFIGHVNSVTSVVLAPDGRTLASASVDGIVKLWDATTTPGPNRTSLDSSVLALTCSPDGKAAVVDQGGAIHVFDPLTGREQNSLPVRKGLGTLVSGAIAPDGKTVAVVDLVTGVLLIDSTSGKERHRLPMASAVKYTLAFSPDGKILAVGGGSTPKSGEVVLWDAATGRQRATLKGHSNQVVSLAFSPNGQTLASGSLDRMVKLWDAIEGKELQTIQGHNKGVFAVAYSRDGSKLATAGGDTLSIREAATGKELRTLRIYSHHVVGMSFNAEGTRLATAGGEDEDSGRGGGVKLWDLTSGQEVLSLGGSTDIFSHIAFSHDGRQLVSAQMIGSFLMGNFGKSSGELVIWNASSSAAADAPSVNVSNRRR
jgi:WD40 repeat protein